MIQIVRLVNQNLPIALHALIHRFKSSPKSTTLAFRATWVSIHFFNQPVYVNKVNFLIYKTKNVVNAIQPTVLLVERMVKNV